MLHKVLTMKNHNFHRSLSNHCMLSCIISVNFLEKCENKHIPLFLGPDRFIWDTNAVHRYQEALCNPSVASVTDDHSFKHGCFPI